MIQLSENKDHLNAICAKLELGQPLHKPTNVSGGFHHRMWKLETNNNQYAIKQLAADTNITDNDVIQHFENTEEASLAFANLGIPAVCALGAGKQAVHIVENSAYLVYPWTAAKALQRSQIRKHHVTEVAHIFASMHQAKLDIPGLTQSLVTSTSEEKLEVLLAFANSRNSSRIKELRELLPRLNQILAQQDMANATLSARSVVSHGDLDHKNILWTMSAKPMLIDWESARYLNPTHETILEALDWSGITLDFNEDLFDFFVNAYRSAGGITPHDEVEAAIARVLGDWLNWLMYNVGRSIDVDDEAQRRIGLEQVDLSLVTFSHLQRITPKLLRKLQKRR